MSRTAIIDVKVTGHDRARAAAIVAAARAVWPFGDETLGGALELSGELGSLHETGEEVAGRLKEAVWSANGAPCGVSVSVTDMEEAGSVEEAPVGTFGFAPATPPDAPPRPAQPAPAS